MTVNSKMTALADEIRELSGTTDTKSLDEMKVGVDAANTEIAEQTELLEQIATALEGKAGSSGGGGGSVETCTVNITMSGGYASESYGALVYENGIYSVKCHKVKNGMVLPIYPITITNVVCNSMLFIHLLAGYPSANISGNCESVGTAGHPYLYFLLSANAGETITIDLYDDD